MGTPSSPIVLTPTRVVNRWIQLIAGIVAMAAIANMQYAWTLFTGPLTTSLHASLPAVQTAFAAFILTETWLVPFEGYLIDRIGPRAMLLAGGVLVGLGWIQAGRVLSVRDLVIWYAVGGIGAGVVYGATIGNALKWFPDRRGLCVGFTAGAYGVGTALTVAPIARMIKTSGYAHTFVVWGFIQGILVLAAALLITKPPAGWAPPGWKQKEAQLKARIRKAAIDMTPAQMVGTGSFWLIYFMMTIVAFGGLVVTAQLGPIAKFYNVDKVTVFWGLSALVVAIELDRVLNGVTRPFWGWVSDHVGRENTMFITFMLEALAVFGLLQLVHHPIWFILMSGFCFFAWGNIFSLFPAITGDLFGQKWCTTNYGVVYTAKGLASVFAGPVAALASVKTGSWVQVFWVMIACDVVAALMALFWLKPMAARTVTQTEMELQARAAGQARISPAA